VSPCTAACLQVPQYILEAAVEAGAGAACSIVCTQPRRIAAMSVAERVAAERGEAAPGQPGCKVGPLSLGSCWPAVTFLPCRTAGFSGLVPGCGRRAALRCVGARAFSTIAPFPQPHRPPTHPPLTQVGYHVRLDAATSADTRLLFCTTGILLRRLAGDPALLGVSHVLVDEVHERTLQGGWGGVGGRAWRAGGALLRPGCPRAACHGCPDPAPRLPKTDEAVSSLPLQCATPRLPGDFLMALLRDLVGVRRAAARPLKVVLMSATLDSDLFAAYFGACPVLHAQVRGLRVCVCLCLRCVGGGEGEGGGGGGAGQGDTGWEGVLRCGGRGAAPACQPSGSSLRARAMARLPPPAFTFLLAGPHVPC
jgi:hypothetical protein